MDEQIDWDLIEKDYDDEKTTYYPSKDGDKPVTDPYEEKYYDEKSYPSKDGEKPKTDPYDEKYYEPDYKYDYYDSYYGGYDICPPTYMDKQIESLTQELCSDWQLTHFMKADDICDRYYEKAYQMDFKGDCERIEQEKAKMLSKLLKLYSK